MIKIKEKYELFNFYLRALPIEALNFLIFNLQMSFFSLWMEDQNEVFTLKFNQNKSLLSNNQSHPFTEKLTILKPKS